MANLHNTVGYELSSTRCLLCLLNCLQLHQMLPLSSEDSMVDSIHGNQHCPEVNKTPLLGSPW